MSEDNNSALTKATDLLNSGSYSEALEQARLMLVSEPNSVDAKLIEAISLSKLGLNRDASEAFAYTIRLDPSNSKTVFNAAVHEFNAGNIGQARLLSNDVSKIDLNHGGNNELRKRIEETGSESKSNTTPDSNGKSSEEGSDEGLSLIHSMGKSWPAVGWMLSLIGIIIFAISVVNTFSNPTELSNVLSGGQNSGKALGSAIGGTNMLLLLFDFVIRLFAIVWMVADMIHRKASFIWLIGHIPCSCVGLGFITQPLYMFFGRK